jgi:hypothetical protein
LEQAFAGLTGRGGGLDPAVDLGVHPADEEGGHAGHPGQVVGPRGQQALQPGEIGLDDVAIALDAEDQGHVDALPVTDHLTDGRDALGRGRYLHQGVGLVDPGVEVAGHGHGAVGVVGQ